MKTIHKKCDCGYCSGDVYAFSNAIGNNHQRNYISRYNGSSHYSNVTREKL